MRFGFAWFPTAFKRARYIETKTNVVSIRTVHSEHPINLICVVSKYFLFSGWELHGLHCYKYFSVRHSWERAAQLCQR